MLKGTVSKYYFHHGFVSFNDTWSQEGHSVSYI